MAGEYDENGLFELEEYERQTTAGADAAVGPTDGRGFIFWDLGVVETVLVIVCAVCAVLLALSVTYFYVVHKLGVFSDNPWYKRRVYYAVSTSASAQNPARCFNVLKRDRPNTLSLSGGVSTPTTVIIPVPMVDAAVGEDKVRDGGKRKAAKSKSMRKNRSAASTNAVGPAPPLSADYNYAKTERGKSRASKQTGYEEAKSDDSEDYVTPPQAPPVRSHKK